MYGKQRIDRAIDPVISERERERERRKRSGFAVLTIIDHQRENMQLLHFVFLGVVTSPSLSLMCN
jgi:hypothetical protein